MDKIIENFSSLQWWIGVVIVGIVINLFSSYFKKGIDDFFSFISNKWKNRSKIKKEKHEMEIQYLIQNPNELSFLGIKELRLRIRSATNIILALMGLVLSQMVEGLGSFVVKSIMVLSVITLFIGLSDHTDAMGVNKLVNAVRKRIKTKKNNK